MPGMLGNEGRRVRPVVLHGRRARDRWHAPSGSSRSPGARRSGRFLRGRHRAAGDRRRPARTPVRCATFPCRRYGATPPRARPRPARPLPSSDRRRPAPARDTGSGSASSSGAMPRPSRIGRARPAITRTTESSAGRTMGRSWCRNASATGARRSVRLACSREHGFATEVARSRDQRAAEVIEQQLMQRTVRQEHSHLAQPWRHVRRQPQRRRTGQQHDRTRRIEQRRERGRLEFEFNAHVGEAIGAAPRIHDRQRFVGPALALTQACDGRLVRASHIRW